MIQQEDNVAALTLAVLFHKNVFPQWSYLQQEFQKIWPSAQQIMADKTKDEGLSLSVGNNILVSISTSTEPIHSNFTNEAAIGSWWWPDLEEDIKKQTGYVFISVFPLERTVSKRTMHEMLTDLTMIILNSENSFGVHYFSSEILVSKKVYLENILGRVNDVIPIMLWVKTCIGYSNTQKDKNGEPLFIARTVGMKNFGLMEIETQNAPPAFQSFQKLVWGMAEHLITKGPVLSDGQTIERTPQERIRIWHKESVFGSGKKVYLLEFQ